MSKKISVKNLTLSAVFVALIVLGGFIRFPIGVIPVTLQTLFVLLAGSLGGKRVGAVSCAVYLLMGLVGIPVFALGGGLFYIFKPTFGYLLAFTVASVIAGTVKRGLIKRIIVNACAVIVIHLIGVSYFYLISNYYLETPISVWESILTGSLFFLPIDIISTVISAILSYKLYNVVHRNERQKEKV